MPFIYQYIAKIVTIHMTWPNHTHYFSSTSVQTQTGFLCWSYVAHGLLLIQGSLEAVSSEKGYLSLKEYQDIGRKRAPNFTGDRATVYRLYMNYRKLKQNRHLFDEQDVVYNLYKRLARTIYLLKRIVEIWKCLQMFLCLETVILAQEEHVCINILLP